MLCFAGASQLLHCTVMHCDAMHSSGCSLMHCKVMRCTAMHSCVRFVEWMCGACVSRVHKYFFCFCSMIREDVVCRVSEAMRGLAAAAAAC